MAMTPRMITIDCIDAQRLASFWSEAADYKIAKDFGGAFIILEPADGEGLALGLQKVPEPRTGKNRVHIDWHSDDRVAEVERLVQIGATVVDQQTVPGGFTWTVLADPEGNEFCVAG
jgi:predicted enzyme related to lactoylglutathione lyase